MQNDFYKLKIIILNLAVFVGSLIIAPHISAENAIKFLSLLPNIFGILLGGIMVSITIIFGLLNSNELKLIYKLSYEKLNKDIYDNFIDKVKIDSILVFISLCISILIMIFLDSEIMFKTYINKLITLNISIKIHTLFVIGIYFLFLSLSAYYDVMRSIFYLQKIRYKLLINENTKMEEND